MEIFCMETSLTSRNIATFLTASKLARSGPTSDKVVVGTSSNCFALH